MSAFQWFLLGGMVALSPSLILLAITLWRETNWPDSETEDGGQT